LSYKTACIGHYYVDSTKTALALLEYAQIELRKAGAQFVIAPMDGNTWRNYRLTSDMFDTAAFFLEKITPSQWCDDFQTAGFERIAQYHSALAENLHYDEKVAKLWEARFAQDALDHHQAYRLNSLDMQNIDEALKEIYMLSLKGFRNNFLYTDISYPEFAEIYRPILPYVVPELVQLAYFNDRLIGFAFGIPDYAQKIRGETIDTLVLKTALRDPAAQFRGLGAFLIWNSHRLAHTHGYKKLISAFMHEQNVSLRLALKSGRLIRNYALYGKAL
jgi:hypothetical protein